MLFVDRTDAGRQPAGRLRHLRGSDVVVLGLPRGGVPVGFEVAEELRAALDVIVVRKLGVPGQPEYGFGAIGEDGTRIIDDRVVRLTALTGPEIAAVEARERTRLDRRIRRLRGDRAPVPLTDRHGHRGGRRDRHRVNGPGGLHGGQVARREPGDPRGAGGLG